MAEYGLSASTLATSMPKDNKSPQGVTAALSKHAKGDLPEGQDPARGLLVAWAPVPAIAASTVIAPATATIYWWYYVPWQECINTVGRSFRQYTQDMTQIRFLIDTVQSAGADQPIQQRTTLSTVIVAKSFSRDRRNVGFFQLCYCLPPPSVITVITEGVL